LKESKNEADSGDETKALTCCLTLIEAESVASKAVKEAQATLDANVLAQYKKLAEAEIKTLVVDGKWFVAIWTALEGEIHRLTQTLAGRVRELEERYAEMLSELECDVNEFSKKVEGHLKQMGLVLA
jgi:type I restriction enzyme M protein